MYNRGKNVQGRIYWLQERETSLTLTLFRQSSYRSLNRKLQNLTVVSYTLNYIVLTDNEWKKRI